MEIITKQIPDMTLAAVHNVWPYAWDTHLFERLFETLMSRAWPNNAINADTQFLAVYYDNPQVVEPSKLRMDIAITIPEDMEVEHNQVQKKNIIWGKYATVKSEIKDPSEYQQIWMDLVNGIETEMDDRPAFEFYLNNPKEHPEGIHIVQLCLAIK